jgi:AcrR family transcriptional regulator
VTRARGAGPAGADGGTGAARAASTSRAPGTGRAAGRRAGDSGTRETILAAARRRFAAHGYDAATIRSIAADAAVDPALVHHFFGSKEQLFVAAMRLPFAPGEMITAALAPGSRAPGVSAGEQLIRTALRAWDDPVVRSTFLGLLRSALTSEQAARMLREFVSETILGPVARAARADRPGDTRDGADAEYRAGMVASQVLGLAVARFVLALGPVASASQDDLAATIGPTLQRYLAGEIRAAGPPGADPGGQPRARGGPVPPDSG